MNRNSSKSQYREKKWRFSNCFQKVVETASKPLTFADLLPLLSSSIQQIHARIDHFRLYCHPKGEWIWITCVLFFCHHLVRDIWWLLFILHLYSVFRKFLGPYIDHDDKTFTHPSTMKSVIAREIRWQLGTNNPNS